MLRRAALLALLLSATPAAAELVSCKTSIRGEIYDFRYDPENAALKDSRSLREKLLGERGDVTCPALVTLRALTPELDDAARAPFCLQWDREAKTYLGYDAGARDAYGQCRKPSKSFCQRLAGTSQAVQGLGADAEGMAAQAAGAVIGDGLGAQIVRDQSGRLRDKLLKAGFGVLAAASPPALAATAVIIGATAYVCSDQGAKGAALQAAAVPDLKSGAEISEGAELLGAKLPETHLPERVEGAPAASVEVTPLSPPEQQKIPAPTAAPSD